VTLGLGVAGGGPAASRAAGEAGAERLAGAVGGYGGSPLIGLGGGGRGAVDPSWVMQELMGLGWGWQASACDDKAVAATMSVALGCQLR
jgi:hypothetical protein